MYNYEKIIEDLLTWYDEHARVLPWRSNPMPYYVWVSEIMLQQTRVEAVKEYFKRFIKVLPDVEALANASEEQLLKLWEGLGYYNRIRNMQAAAITIIEEYDGVIPSKYEELLKLKGIGSYTAGAIASIAYGKRVPAVDGNVLRVMKRLAGSYDDIGKVSVKRELEEKLTAIMPERAGAFNQAVMDIGAMVCIPNGQPLCEECPLLKHCEAKKQNIVMELPVKAKKKARRVEEKTILLIEYQGKYALRKRVAKGLLAGLWELPSVEGKWERKDIGKFLREQNQKIKVEELGEAVHIFSHIEWDMTGYRIILSEPLIEKEYVWATPKELEEVYAVPTAFAKYLKQIGC